MKLSEKILTCRKRAMLSQEALAERIGVSRQAISKWETGEAMPEVNKLLALAQTFGVTTDWLLSEDEPEPEAVPIPEPTREPQSVSSHTWVDDVPGMLGKLLRKYGWLFGVRLAIGGAALIAFSIFISMMSNTFFRTTSSFSSPFGTSSAIFYDERGNVISNPEAYNGIDLYDALGMNPSGSVGSWDREWNDFEVRGRGMFGLFSGFVMLVGSVMLIAGIFLTVKLKGFHRS